MTNKTYGTYGIIVVFSILNFTFSLLPASAAEQQIIQIGSFCFRKAECVSYNATASPRPDPVCSHVYPGHNELAVKNEYIYTCYANQPTVKLQVSIGGYQVQGIETYIRRLYITLVGLTGIVAGLMIVWAGVKWLTSAGAPERITSAKQKIANACVGLVLVFGSYVILQTINPALVKFKLPPVKIPRTELLQTDEWCVKRTEFKCGGDEQAPDGQYDCSRAYGEGNFACGQPKAGKCYGQYCTEGGCHKIVPDRLTGSVRVARGAYMTLTELGDIQSQLARGRSCFDSAQCNDCNLPLNLGDGNFDYAAMARCASTACNCLVISVNGSPVCTKRKTKGESCGTDQECESSNCNFGGVNECAPSPNGEGCQDDNDCESGICNSVDESVAGMGIGANGACRAPRSLPLNEMIDDCDRGALCKSGYQCINETIVGINMNVPYGGPYSGPQPSAEIATGNAECETPDT